MNEGKMELKLNRIVSFQLDQQLYGISIDTVHEIVHPLPLTYVPGAPDFVDGVINLRGQILPVVNLQKRFSITRGYTQNFRYIVVNIRGVMTALKVESVRSVMEVGELTIDPVPQIVSGIDTEFLAGMLTIPASNEKEKPTVVTLFTPEGLMVGIENKIAAPDAALANEMGQHGSMSQSEEIEQIETLQILHFRIGNEWIGISVNNVVEILDPMDITPVPNAPFYIVGIILLRKHIIPQVDFSKIIPIHKGGMSEEKSIIVLEINGTLFAVEVDEVESIVTLPLTEIVPLSNTMTDEELYMYQGIWHWKKDALVSVLNMDHVFSSSAIEVLKEVSDSSQVIAEEEELSAEMTTQSIIKVGNDEYGIDIHDIQEIITVSNISPVPHAADYILGVINLRGEIVAVVDLRRRFEFPPLEGSANDTRIVIVSIMGVLTGLLVDSVVEVTSFEKNRIEDPPPSIKGSTNAFPFRCI